MIVNFTIIMKKITGNNLRFVNMLKLMNCRLSTLKRNDDYYRPFSAGVFNEFTTSPRDCLGMRVRENTLF